MNSTVFFVIIIIISTICIGVGIYIYNKDNNTTDDNTDVISKIDCQLSSWGEWSECQNGSKTKIKTIVTNPKNGGKECGALSKVQDCTAEVEEGDGSITGFIKGTYTDGDDYYLNWTGLDFLQDITGNQKSLCWNKSMTSTFTLEKNGFLKLSKYTGTDINDAPLYKYASYKTRGPCGFGVGGCGEGEHGLYLKSGVDNLKLKIYTDPADDKQYLKKTSNIGPYDQFVTLFRIGENTSKRNFAVFKNNKSMEIKFVDKFGDKI